MNAAVAAAGADKDKGGPGGGGAAMGAIYAIEDMAQSLEADVTRVAMDKEALAAALADAVKHQQRAEAKASALQAEIRDLTKRAGLQNAEINAAAGSAVRYHALEDKKRALMEEVETAEVSRPPVPCQWGCNHAPCAFLCAT